jgi:3-methylcrotonyl-CoA carboxylase alpha subunit
MRKVDAPGDFLAALESCKREAKSSFANDEVLLEKWITSPRHIEVQVFGDSHGNVVHLFERDCSLQRRHQKVIEEAPAPGMDAATREAICAAAVRAARAVDYVGAGTIEFIAGASQGLRADRVFFMEMNTRLQVEHPVTEEITGVDLVEWQLRVASGEPLPLRQEELSINGHAIEARLYAEDPAKGFLPSTGRLEHLEFGELQRIETGVEEGGTISPFYDPMIAKLVSHALTRSEAIDDLHCGLIGTEVWPVRTNAAFVARAIDDQDFRDAKLDTGFVDRKGDALIPPTEADDATWKVAALLSTDRCNEGPLAGFRLNASQRNSVAISALGETRSIDLDDAWSDTIRVVSEDGDIYSTDSGDAPVMTGAVIGETVVVFNEGSAFEFALAARGTGLASAHDGDILAPMPGKVIAVDVTEGQPVEAGQRLLVLEAMKMEHALTAPFAGTVAELSAQGGQQVQVEALLARVVKARVVKAEG